MGRHFLTIYLGGVGLLGVYALLRVLYGLNRTRLNRLRRLGRKRGFESVATDTPLEDPVALARRRAEDSIDAQFTVTRRFLVPMLLLAIGAAASLPFLDQIPATFVSVVVAVATLVVGVASRPFLENAMAGLVVSSSRLINLGDTIKLGEFYGTVEDITATHTTIKLWDWRRYVVPNREMLQASFLNYSLFDRYIWTTVELWVAYESDVDQVRELAISAASASPHFSGSEPPDFWVLGLEPDGVRCVLAAWADLPSHAWLLAHDVRTSIARDFRTHGIRGRVQHHQPSPPFAPGSGG